LNYNSDYYTSAYLVLDSMSAYAAGIPEELSLEEEVVTNLAPGTQKESTPETGGSGQTKSSESWQEGSQTGAMSDGGSPETGGSGQQETAPSKPIGAPQY